jgi:hypothetical protein
LFNFEVSSNEERNIVHKEFGIIGTLGAIIYKEEVSEVSDDLSGTYENDSAIKDETLNILQENFLIIWTKELLDFLILNVFIDQKLNHLSDLLDSGE